MMQNEDMTSLGRRNAVIETVAMAALLLSYIWLWQGAFPGDFFVVVLLYATLGIGSHLRRGETAAEVGFRLDNLGPATLLVLLIIVPLVVVTLLTGLALGSLDLEPGSGWPLGLLMSYVSGTLQQYGLLAFFYRSLREILSDDRSAAVTAATMFAIFHLPNPFLTVVTGIAGLLSVWFYRKTRNLWSIGLGHMLLSLAISRGLPRELTLGLRVGPGCWSEIETLWAPGSSWFLPWL